MTRPSVSVIVPVYKVEPYLRKCLDSIVMQTVKDIEIILVDDGSPDNSGAICDEYAAKDDRIVVIHQQNAGVSAARNAGIDAASGEWLTFVDSDDWLETDMFAYLLGLARQYEADLVQCGMLWEEDGKTEKLFIPPVCRTLPPVCAFSNEDWALFSNSVSNKLYRRTVAKDLRFNEQCAWGEDLMYNIEFLLCTERAVLGTEAKYHYLQRSDSACHRNMTHEAFLKRWDSTAQAVKRLEFVPVVSARTVSVLMESALDTASKLVLSGKRDKQLKNSIRRIMRKSLPVVWHHGLLSKKDQMKSVLICWAWPLYRVLLLMSKK